MNPSHILWFLRQLAGYFLPHLRCNSTGQKQLMRLPLYHALHHFSKAWLALLYFEQVHRTDLSQSLKSRGVHASTRRLIEAKALEVSTTLLAQCIGFPFVKVVVFVVFLPFFHQLLVLEVHGVVPWHRGFSFFCHPTNSTISSTRACEKKNICASVGYSTTAGLINRTGCNP